MCWRRNVWLRTSGTGWLSITQSSKVLAAPINFGAQRPLFDGLDHDQQEAWAIFGPYPNFAWTPDGAHLVFWAQGKVWKLEVASRQVEEIPFEAEVKQTITEAARYAQEVSPESFEVKMIRDAVTSPDGQHLVFNALGHLWKKSLPAGA